MWALKKFHHTYGQGHSTVVGLCRATYKVGVLRRRGVKSTAGHPDIQNYSSDFLIPDIDMWLSGQSIFFKIKTGTRTGKETSLLLTSLKSTSLLRTSLQVTSLLRTSLQATSLLLTSLQATSAHRCCCSRRPCCLLSCPRHLLPNCLLEVCEINLFRALRRKVCRPTHFCAKHCSFVFRMYFRLFRLFQVETFSPKNSRIPDMSIAQNRENTRIPVKSIFGIRNIRLTPLMRR